MSERLRVLLIVASYLPNLGGLQSVTSNLAVELQKRGYAVAVLAQHYPRALPVFEEIGGVSVQRLLFLTPRLRDLQRGRWDLFFAGLFYFPTSLVRLLWRIAHDKPDVVNLHFVGAPALFLLIARVLMRFRFVVSLHGDDVEGLARGTWFDHWIFRAALWKVDAVTACSHYLLNKALAIEPSIVCKARVVYNGMWTENVKVVATNDAILGVGRLVPSKGWDSLLRALARCRQAGCRVRLILIGDGPERSSLEALTRKLEIDDCVDFRGAQEHDIVIQTICASLFVVIPSRHDTFGLVALEAMAVGKPVIATRVGGLPEVLENADAELVEPDNPSELAQAMASMLERIKQERGYGARNREIAARFSIARMVDQYLMCYQSGVIKNDVPSGSLAAD